MSFRTTVGNAEIIALLDLPLAFPYNVFFPTISADKWPDYRKMYPRSNAEENFATNAQAFIVRSGGRTLLIDCGVGPGPHEGLGGWRGSLEEDMGSAGVSPEQIDTVVFTHLHFDHTGWALHEKNPRFTNARYIAPEEDFKLLGKGMAGFPEPEAVTPLQDAGRLDLVSGEKTLTPEITTLPTPGHTPGHQSIVIVSAGQRAIITGDIAHHPAQVQETEWNSGFDSDPGTAAATRGRVMERLERDGALAVLGHFPHPGMGRIVREGGKRIFRAL